MQMCIQSSSGNDDEGNRCIVVNEKRKRESLMMLGVFSVFSVGWHMRNEHLVPGNSSVKVQLCFCVFYEN